MTAVSVPPNCNSIIQVVNEANLSKIESFFDDSAYREAIENSSTYNSRLCRERRLRMPFLDSQTGVAQNHSALFMSPRERLPGLQHGQIYTYPSKRWRKKRRQYLMNYFHPTSKRLITRGDFEDGIECAESNGPGPNDDSKDSLALKEEHSKDAWFYDEQDMLDIDPYEEPDQDSDFDYEESYSSKRKRRKPRGGAHHPVRSHPPASESPAGKRTKGGGRGRKKINYDASDTDKPFVCDPIGNSLGQQQQQQPGNPPPGSKDEHPLAADSVPSSQLPSAQQQQQQQQQNSGAGSTSSSPKPPLDHPQQQSSPGVPAHHPANHQHHAGGKNKNVNPSPYCDFCLGDARENKKTGGSEELVSCSDCGRSGHPTCLQFTANMIVSVRKYRWQCIECKCCSICGTSDNDDQLLFCDDCDRGYHMYCLAPPLTSPPEGSWSCRLCIAEFHQRN